MNEIIKWSIIVAILEALGVATNSLAWDTIYPAFRNIGGHVGVLSGWLPIDGMTDALLIIGYGYLSILVWNILIRRD